LILNGFTGFLRLQIRVGRFDSGPRLQKKALQVRAFLFLHRMIADGTDSVKMDVMMTLLANDQDHHPEVWSCQTQMRIRLWTHDAGGLTDKDIRLAMAIDQLNPNALSGN
jgi:pterin-4a-carbinolamine dehydratase